MDLTYYAMLALLVFGFGFVIFWHELGHFLAAKWAGVRVEQFAVGFGQALISWRKGLGFRRGTSAQEYQRRLVEFLTAREASDRQQQEKVEYRGEQLEYASRELGISETEYRLNWIPLGGYVKMLGQDDMDPNAQSDSPRAFNNKSIGKRMVIVSAGVIMNIILAIVFFTILFRMGFNVPPPVVGMVQPGSPAQLGGIQVGDRILSYDGRVQHDFTKFRMNVALSEAGQPVKVVVDRPGAAQPVELTIEPKLADSDAGGFLQVGIGQAQQLQGFDPKGLSEKELALFADEPVKPGETIVEINGEAVDLKEAYKLDRAVQKGEPVKLGIVDAAGQRHDRTVTPSFVPPFGKAQLNFAGLMPRTVVESVESWSSAKDKLKAGDIIQDITVQPGNDPNPHPARDKLMKVLNDAGQNGRHVDITVIRDGQPAPLVVKELDPSVRLQGQNGRKGLGITLKADEEHPIVADVLQDSAAHAAGIPSGAQIVSIDSHPVKNWRDINRILAGLPAGKSVRVAFTSAGGDAKEVDLTLNAEQLAGVQQNRYYVLVPLRELNEPRQTTNPLTAAKWGLAETRDLTLQFYVTLRRMFQGSVPASAGMGPLGIFQQGSRIAQQGMDWLIWFLAMISANLAVVNFLPVPIVDGGLFVFLIIEKIMGKPLSPRAQSIAQIVGLALILSVFLFVTYHDIYRMVY